MNPDKPQKFYRTVKVMRRTGQSITAYISEEGEEYAQYFTMTTYGPVVFQITEPKKEIMAREIGLK